LELYATKKAQDEKDAAEKEAHKKVDYDLSDVSTKKKKKGCCEIF